MRLSPGNRFLGSVAMLAFLLPAEPVNAQAPAAPSPEPFSHETVKHIAADLASKSFQAPTEENIKGLQQLNYDQYRQLRFRRERTIWRGEGRQFELQVLPTGWLFKMPVEINIVEGGVSRPLSPDNSYFDLGPLAGKLPPEARLNFSGFRVTGPMNRPDIFDEIIVFQGASYFRALSRNQIYGLSARGLTLNVAQPGGEEFPFFRAFWLERPEPNARAIVIHALLDSPSVAGAYRFVVTPGAPTAIDVETTLYPRRDLQNVGIAPLTSMFLFSSINRARVSDFRPAVHDSDGLAIVNGWSERLWRPLNNPKRLQTSAFLDENPIAFGLIQRARSFADYQDLEARYERRPSAWVETQGAWGPGAVELVEIPTEEEIHDNIVAYWRPSQPLAAGKAHHFAYRLSWPDDVYRTWPGATIRATRAGVINGPLRKTGAIQFVVDLTSLTGLSPDTLPEARVEVSAGAVSAPVVQANPETDGLRVSFSYDPKGATSSEFRMALYLKDKAVSETWLYRWLKD
jgi:periplasmic glucans biosynthesis protein